MARKREVLSPTAPLLCDPITEFIPKIKLGIRFFGPPCISRLPAVYRILSLEQSLTV